MPRKRKGGPPAHLNVRVDRDLLEEMRVAAARDERSLNYFVNAAIRRQLRQLMPETMDQLEGKKGRKR